MKAYKDAVKTDPNARIKFAFNVYSERANNPQGYSWVFENLLDAATDNPLDQLFDLASAKSKALPAPASAPKQLAATAPGKK